MEAAGSNQISVIKHSSVKGSGMVNVHIVVRVSRKMSHAAAASNFTFEASNSCSADRS